MKLGALIPCRKGSKGIAGKNFCTLNGKPLWRWSCDVAVNSRIFHMVLVSSDNEELRFEQDIHPNMIIDYMRPAEFSTDTAQLDPLMIYYAKKYPDIEGWVLLQPTSPLRTVGDIKEVVGLLCIYDSVVSVERVSDKYWRHTGIPLYDPFNRKNRQDSLGLLHENGSIYAVRTGTLLDNKCRVSGKIGFYEMPHGRSLQIDTHLDWILCDAVMQWCNHEPFAERTKKICIAV